MSEFELAGRKIGPQHPPLVMAEAGINHEGELAKALQLVDAAQAAGADVIKFQCHITEAEMIPTDMTPGEISSEKLWDIIKRCELSEDEERQVRDYCADKGILYLSTPFSREAADRLQAMGVPGFKIGSGECNNLPLLKHIASFGKPMILSTGMNDLSSVRRSLAVIQEAGAPVMLMHCTSLYPTPYDKVRLGAIPQMIDAFGLPVGLSDHSLGIWACLGAVALGACLLEKHFTISRDWPGPDTGLSIEPDELAQLVTGARAVWQASGGGKGVLADERPVIEFAYASVVTIAPVKAGEVFSHANTWVKRPGTGPILAPELERVLGKKAARDLAADQQVAPGDVVDF